MLADGPWPPGLMKSYLFTEPETHYEVLRRLVGGALLGASLLLVASVLVVPTVR